MATMLVLGRLCDASSELHLAEQFSTSSALPDLLSVPAGKVTTTVCIGHWAVGQFEIPSDVVPL
jgi:hypothetical protein